MVWANIEAAGLSLLAALSLERNALLRAMTYMHCFVPGATYLHLTLTSTQDALDHVQLAPPPTLDTFPICMPASAGRPISSSHALRGRPSGATVRALQRRLKGRVETLFSAQHHVSVSSTSPWID